MPTAKSPIDEEFVEGFKMRNIEKVKVQKLIIKKCHSCGQVIESTTEQEKCVQCGKAFLPLNYFAKVHSQKGEQYQNLFAESHELHEDDLVRGLYVLW